MKSDVKEITPKSDYPASHYPSVAAPGDVDMNLGYWSHVYNKVDESYADAADGTFGGFSIKAGNALLPKDKTKKALLRLPKADTNISTSIIKVMRTLQAKLRLRRILKVVANFSLLSITMRSISQRRPRPWELITPADSISWPIHIPALSRWLSSSRLILVCKGNMDGREWRGEGDFQCRIG